MNSQERTDMINKRLQEHMDYLTNNTEYEVFGLFLQGSQNYNLDIYTDDYKSDIDSRAIILPKFEDFVVRNERVSKTIVLDNNEHIDVKDIRTMFEMFRHCNLQFIELLWTDFYIINEKYKKFYDELIAIRDDIIDYPRFIKCCIGMMKNKRAALCHPYPTIKWKIDKWGYDGKQLHHIIRIYFLLCKISEYKKIDKDTWLPYADVVEDLIRVKENKLEADLSTVIQTADNFIKWGNELADEMLALDWDEPTKQDLLDNIIIEVFTQYFKETIKE